MMSVRTLRFPLIAFLFVLASSAFCNYCVPTLTGVIEGIDGVTGVEFASGDRSVDVVFDADEVTAEGILAIITGETNFRLELTGLEPVDAVEAGGKADQSDG